MGRRPNSSGIADLIGSIFVLLVFAWVAWILFAKIIIAWLTELLVSTINTVIRIVAFLFVLGIGFYVAWKSMESNRINSGWGVLLTIVILLVLGYLQLGAIGPISILADFGAMAAFIWKFIDQAQCEGLSGGFI